MAFRNRLLRTGLTGTTGIAATPEQRPAAERFEAWMWRRHFNGQQPLGPIRFDEASVKFLARARAECSRRPASYQRFEASMVCLRRALGSRLVHEIEARDLEAVQNGSPPLWREGGHRAA